MNDVTHKSLPRRGHAPDEVIEALEALRAGDVDWAGGKVWSLVFDAGAEHRRLLERAYTAYFAENALNPTAFPSLRRMENEVVAMTAHLLGGGPEVVGSMTTGGTESILMAVKTAREWARARRSFWPRGAGRPQMVLPSTAHPAFDKAAHYFGVEIVRVPVRADFRADVPAMARAIGRRTILVVGSAPSYPQGVVDPIEQLAALAARRGILCHVDACVGGFMLPFVRALGRTVPAFDLGVPGVTSLSVDLHKYGYAPKGASVVLYRDAALRKHQFFATTDWPGGIYCSPSMTGTRSGGAIAAAWAGLQHLGHEGYLDIARQVMSTVDELRRGIDAIPGLRVLGDPEMSVLSIGSDSLDVWEIGDEMGARGWHLDRQQFPASLHLTVNFAHVGRAERFLEDLAAAARIAPAAAHPGVLGKAKDALLRAAVRVLPAPVVTKVTEVAASAMGLDGGELPERKAAMYGLMASLPNRGDLATLVKGAFDRMMRYAPEADIPIGPRRAAPANGTERAAVRPEELAS